MGKHVCLNGTMAGTNNYSSPVPVIGVYIAAASLVCFLHILFDVWSGFRQRKLWFPCRFFSVNSVTLTLLSIASKIPVDLTTDMPSVQDQLNKLTGTVFICMTIAFMIPSVGTNGEFESYANATAVTIFVVTVAVNICIQMATGVIFSFIVEHSFILFCMLLLLVRFWAAVILINSKKGGITDTNIRLMRRGEESMLQRLKVCYLHGYNSSPQFILSCKDPYSAHLSLVVAACFLVLTEVVVRMLVFKDLKFCAGVSDYGWSMWLILGVQGLTIVVVTFAILCRWLIFANLWDIDSLHFFPDRPYVQFLYYFSLSNLPKSLEVIFRFVIFYPLVVLNLVMAVLGLLLAKTITFVTKRSCGDKLTNEERMEEYGWLRLVLHDGGVPMKPWILTKSVDDMERWMEMNQKCSFKNLRDLLSRVTPSEDFFTSPISGASSLSILLLAELVKFLTPTSFNATITNVLGDLFDIIDFVDSIVNVRSSENRLRSMYTKIIQKFGYNQYVVHKNILEEIMEVAFRPQLEYYQALEIMRNFKKLYEEPTVRERANDIVDFLLRRSYVSCNEINEEIDKVFVGMLHVCLSPLPEAIFKYILESPMEEYEKRTRLGLGIISRFESLDFHISWKFPMGSALTRLSNTQVERCNSRTITLIEDDRVETENAGQTRFEL